MSVEERFSVIEKFRPEMASANAGSMNFCYNRLLADVDETVYDWEREYVERTWDNVFRNSFRDMEYCIRTMNDCGTLDVYKRQVIFLASLKQIPEDYYEAATLDGAGRVAQFFKITLPLLTPMVFFNIVMQVINAFQSFNSAYIISNGTGGPLDSTLFYSLYLYIKAFNHFQMGYASAMAWILLVIIAAVTGLMFLFAKFWVFYDD